MLPLSVNFAAIGFIQWIIIAIVVAGVVGIAMVVSKQAGIVIPAFIVTIFWIVLAVVVGVIAIKFLASMV
ncbi:MAG: hypothetical protein WC455_11390 [Dehalococcoidia bacterium]|jgi:hypothetical protein